MFISVTQVSFLRIMWSENMLLLA